MRRKNGYKVSFFSYILMAISFALAVFDMQMLQSGLNVVLNGGSDEVDNTALSSLLAFAIATTANIFALTWGIKNGTNKAQKKINKKSAIGLVGWLCFGVFYGVIKAIDIMQGGDDINWSIQIGGIVMLAVSYIFSGIAIEDSASEIWDADANSCRTAEADFNLKHRQIAKEDSGLNKMLNTLENYNDNYDILDKQYEQQLDAIRHAEDSIINEILGKTLLNNPEIDPESAEAVVEQAKKASE